MPNKRTLKLLLEYDGTRFAGWQIQPDARTVQYVIEQTLETILHQPVSITAAGRTDAGVHALGQVASCTITSEIDLSRLHRALNGILPKDVTVLTIAEMPQGFNARYNARSRTYRYTMSDRRISIGRQYVWHVKYNLSRELLKESVRFLNGHCNLKGFSKGDNETDFATFFHTITWIFQDHLMICELSAVRFFHHSVRSIIGTVVQVARGKVQPDIIQRILETGDRSLAGPTAPARGLCLVNVAYGDI
jgi:tRNA pseudouridine38-40 synthase